MSEDTRYNGWRNYQTWNVALWISNDESYYIMAKGEGSYKAFVETLEVLGDYRTPDKVAWNDSGLDTDALDEMIAEL